jgi:hypothetical protein
MNELELRQLYVELQPGERVEVIHHITIGFREHETRTIGTVVKKERCQCGIDNGFGHTPSAKDTFPRLGDPMAIVPRAEVLRLATAIRGITEAEVVPLGRFARQHRMEMRFIEFMPLDAENNWQTEQVRSGKESRKILEAGLLGRGHSANGQRRRPGCGREGGEAIHYSRDPDQPRPRPRLRVG